MDSFKDNVSLISDVHDYLYDAGFGSELYVIEDFNNTRMYVEVFFLCNGAVDYILNDIKTSDYKNILEITEYIHPHYIKTIIVTYLD